MYSKYSGVEIVIIVILGLAISWGATCGIIKLITMCFGWQFKWHVATGIWLIMRLASTVFKSSGGKS